MGKEGRRQRAEGKGVVKPYGHTRKAFSFWFLEGVRKVSCTNN
jgi:hypothetical protein